MLEQYVIHAISVIKELIAIFAYLAITKLVMGTVYLVLM